MNERQPIPKTVLDAATAAILKARGLAEVDLSINGMASLVCEKWRGTSEGNEASTAAAAVLHAININELLNADATMNSLRASLEKHFPGDTK